MSDLPLLPDQPSTADQLRRFGPAALMTLIGLLFILQNTESTTFSFLWFNFRSPLWIMLLVSMGIGAIAAYGIGRHRRSRNERN